MAEQNMLLLYFEQKLLHHSKRRFSNTELCTDSAEILYDKSNDSLSYNLSIIVILSKEI